MMLRCLNWQIYAEILLCLMVILEAPPCWGITDPRDVIAINGLYGTLGFPPLSGWVPAGGDPCGEGWQGVLCVNANITGLVLNGTRLGGSLVEDLGLFSSIIQMDLSNNHIGGSIPLSLPVTIRSFSLASNRLIGSIPDSLSSLGQLTELSLNNNQLTGVIPDAFQQFTGLTSLDLSGNALNGQLPASMANLSSLTTLYLQDNHLVGTLDVLQDLHLDDLNVENNLFSGPIPPKLQHVRIFRHAGNPFNTSSIPSPPSSPRSPSPSGAPPPGLAPGKEANGPAAPDAPHGRRGRAFLATKRVIWIAIAVFLIFVVLALVFSLLMSRCCKGRHEIGAFTAPKEISKYREPSLNRYNYNEKVPSETLVRAPIGDGTDHGRINSMLKPEAKRDRDFETTTAKTKHNMDHGIDMRDMDANIQPAPPQLSSLLPVERVTAKPTDPPTTTRRHTIERVKSARSFTIASLQQYTNSFSQENLVGGGILGKVYRAELPNGKVLAIKKLDFAASRQQGDKDFLEVVSIISKLQHANIVPLAGYCAEHGQRLLAYEYCRNGTLHEALHVEDEIHNKLSWNTRTQLALQSARALEYLHEVSQPPIVHHNFKSVNILLDDELSVRVADCGLVSLLSTSYITQLQGLGYGAPELELGSYTYQSDVYSFGVVMLELLTGRKAYDRSRPRGEQFLVRWAIPQLHDIDALSRMVDPSLNGAYPPKSLSRFADIISLCVQSEPEFRPPMSEIVENLVYMIQRDC